MCELEIGRVGREQTGGLGVSRGEAHLRVDVEQARGTAGGPDGRNGVGGVVLEVVTCHRALEGVLSGRLVGS